MSDNSANRLKIIFYFYYWQTVCSDNLTDSTQTPEAKAILRNLDLGEGLAEAEIADVRNMHRLRIGAYFKMTETGKKDVFPAHRCLERKHVFPSSKAKILDAYLIYFWLAISKGLMYKMAIIKVMLLFTTPATVVISNLP